MIELNWEITKQFLSDRFNELAIKTKLLSDRFGEFAIIIKIKQFLSDRYGEQAIKRKAMNEKFEIIKSHVLEHYRKNAHFSFHRDSEFTKAIEAMGEPAVGPLFVLMDQMPQEAFHFGYNIIPRIIDPPDNIKERMNEALDVSESVLKLNVPLMEEVYKEWAIQEKYIVTTLVHCKKARYDVYIGRPTKWGNPFVVGEHGTREEVIEKYEEWIRTQPELILALEELKGKVLGCWCSPKSCHGDVLIKLVNEFCYEH